MNTEVAEHLRRTLGKRVKQKVLRGFESLPLCFYFFLKALLLLYLYLKLMKNLSYLKILFLLVFPTSFYSQLLINEVSVHKGYYDEFQEENDWIEIINSGSNTVNLYNYFMSDDPNNLQKWRFPNYQLPANEKIIIFASNKTLSFYPSHWENIVKANDIWKYKLGSSTISSHWNSLNFDDQLWNSGQGGIGYGDNDDNTIISNTISVFIRKNLLFMM